jgi:fructose-specific phosphotransferase system IIC component
VVDIQVVLTALGMDGPSLVAGFIGGLISTFFDKQTNARETVGILLTGTFLPAYGATTFADLVHLPHVLTALFLGYGGIAVLRAIYTKFLAKAIGEQKDA